MSDQSLGFPNAPKPLARPTPVSPRPKGRWLIGLLLILGCGYIAYNLWDAFLRHSAHGIVTGRIVEIAPPYGGTISSLNVQEGSYVKQGQTLAVVENLELIRSYDRTKDELQMANAQMDAELAKLKIDMAFQLEGAVGITANYYQTLSLLGQEQGRMEEYYDFYLRAQRLLKDKAISAEEASASKFRYEGQKVRVQELKHAVEELKKRIEGADKFFADRNIAREWKDRLKPFALKIEQASSDIERIRFQIDAGRLVAPISGTLVKRHHFAGEYCDVGKPIFSILEDNSLYIVLYLQQSAVNDYKIGDRIDLYHNGHPLSCTVFRIGDKYEQAPDSIKRYYKVAQNLMPVYLHMDDTHDMRYGAVVNLPYKWR